MTFGQRLRLSDLGGAECRERCTWDVSDLRRVGVHSYGSLLSGEKNIEKLPPYILTD